MSKKSSSFHTALSCQSRTISYYCQQIEQQRQILRHVQSILPSELAKQTRHCLIKDKKLLIYTDSAIWASQLRFYNKIILASISQLGRQAVETVQVKILTEPTGLGLQSSRNARIPSAATIAIIRNNSLSVSDNQLKQALLRLSSTLERISAEN